jgi:cell division protein FtsW (lipid II flippase)
LLLMQLIWAGLGVVACGVAMFFDYRLLKKISLPLLVFCVVLLVIVLFFPEVNGARRWIRKGVFRLQPSELAKLSLIIFLAHYCERYLRQMQSFKRGVLIPAGFCGVVMGLIFVEPDVGNTMLLAAVCSILLLVAGLRWRYFLPPVILGALAISLFIYHDPMRSKRIYSWLHLEETKKEKGHQAYQAMVAWNRRRGGAWSQQWQAKTGICSRASHRFYFFNYWRGVGFDRHTWSGPGFCVDLVEWHLYFLASAGHFWTSSRFRHYLHDRNSSLHKYRCRDRCASK